MPRLFPDYKFTDRHLPDSIIQAFPNRVRKMAAGKVVVGKKDLAPSMVAIYR